MKEILIAPHYIRNQKIQQLTTSIYISDYLLDKGFLPIMPVFHSILNTKSKVFEVANKYIENTSALVLQGGHDIGTEQNRDIFEIALLELALVKKIPIFGVCRGLQLINIYFGGSLKNVEKHMSLKDKLAEDLNFNTVNLDLEHEIKLVKNGLLANSLSLDFFKVNSAHRQAIDNLGKGLSLEAVSVEDGVIESISNINQKILAVQWHPELDLKHENRAVFDTWLNWV